MYYNEKTAARLINSMFRANKNDNREFAHHAYFDKQGRQCALDGYRAYRLKKPVAGVPDMDAFKGIDLDKIIPAPATLEKYFVLELPALADVKTMLAEDNAAKRRKEEPTFAFTFGLGENGKCLPALNLAYLADMLQMFPDATARCNAENPFGPVIFTSPDGDGVLCPVRLKNPNDAITRRKPAPKKDDPCKGLPVYGLRTFLALAAAANA